MTTTASTIKQLINKIYSENAREVLISEIEAAQKHYEEVSIGDMDAKNHGICFDIDIDNNSMLYLWVYDHDEESFEIEYELYKVVKSIDYEPFGEVYDERVTTDLEVVEEETEIIKKEDFVGYIDDIISNLPSEY